MKETNAHALFVFSSSLDIHLPLSLSFYSTMLTAFDYPTSLSIRSADIDICLIGDSLANVCLGYSTTQSLTLSAMIHHCQSVQRGLSSPLFSIENPNSTSPKPLVIADLPFGTFMTLEEGISNSIQLIQKGGIDGLKIEGGQEVLPLIKKLTDFGIPVMAHLGLQPQKVASTSGYRVQAKTAQNAFKLLKECRNAQENGAFAILLECIPTRIGELISKELEIPTIGIGAGRFTDGQVLVVSDMLGELTSPAHVLAGLQESISTSQENNEQSSSERTTEIVSSPPPRPSENSPLPPKFVRSFVKSSGTSLGALRIQAVRDYVDAVRDRSFPNDQESYKIEKKELEALLELVEKEKRKEGEKEA